MCVVVFFFFFKQKTAYEMRISDWSSDVCSSDLTEYKRGEIADFAERVVSLLDAAQVPLDAKVGVVVRNRVLHAAAMLGLIGHGRPLTTIYAIQSPEAIGAEIAASGFGAVIADASDWTQPVKDRSEEHTSELQSLMRISYAVFCLKKKKHK